MSSAKKVFMFSGQGSQYYQMGRSLYLEETCFHKWMHRMDAIAYELVGCSIIDTLYNSEHSKTKTFSRTLLTHPAIFMVEYALAQTLIEADVIPDLTLGTSMGSFAAAAVARCIGYEDALIAVVNEAKIYESLCHEGGMIAILAGSQLYDEDILKNNSEIAAYNFSTHFVVSAKFDCLSGIEAFLREKCVTFQRLPVSFAYHSQWIDEANEPIQSYSKSLNYLSATIPMVCCAKSATLNFLPPDYFWTVAREPIQFQQSIEQLEMNGSYHYVDVGPAGTLATFLKYSLPSTSTSRIWPILSPFGHELKNLTLIRTEVARPSSQVTPMPTNR